MLKKIILSTALLLFLPSTGTADELLGSYVALLSSHDHFNSRGARLTKPWQIIRQDRANFHKFGIRDRLDQPDTFFHSIHNRSIAERMVMNGYIAPGLSNRITNGEVAVRVEIYGRGLVGTSLRILVY